MEREVIDEVIIETKPISNDIALFIHGRVKFFDKAGNIVLGQVIKQQKFNIFTYDSEDMALPICYTKAKEIHIQRASVSKIIVLSKKRAQVSG